MDNKAVFWILIGLLLCILAEPVVFRLGEMDCLNACNLKYKPIDITLYGGSYINGTFGQLCYCDFVNKTNQSLSSS